MFNLLDEELQKELIDFCNAEAADKTRKPLNVCLASELLRQITLGQREITGLVTNSETGDIFVRFSLTNKAEGVKR